MLQFFRSGLTSYFATALLGLLIASFALWGIGGNVLSGIGNNVASIGDDHITMNDYARDFQTRFTQIQQQSGGQVTQAMVIDRGLARNWLAELVQRKSFAYAAHDMNIRVSDKQLRDYIMGIEAFQNTLGQFSKDNFENIARMQGYTASQFEELLRRDLQRQSLMTALVGGLAVPNALETAFERYLREERQAEIITIPTPKDMPIPEEAVLQQYYSDRMDNYKTPEYRDFRFIHLSADAYATAVTISDDELDQALQATQDQGDQNEKRNFQHVLFDDRESADTAWATLEKGGDFAALIADAGLAPQDATLNNQSLSDVSENFGTAAATALFAAPEGGYTAPVETDFGWRLFLVNTITQAESKTDQKAETLALLKQEKALNLLYDKSEQINDELAAGAGLSDIAATLKLDLKVALNVDRTGYDAAGNLAPGLPTDPAFLEQIFTRLQGDEPVLEELGNGDYYLAIVDRIAAPEIQPFEAVKDSVVTLWKADESRRQAQATATDILAQLRNKDSDVTTESLAKTVTDAQYSTVTAIRNDQTGTLETGLKNVLFSLALGEADMTPAADGNGFVVIRLAARTLPDEPLPLAEATQLKKYLAQEAEQRVLSGLWTYLESHLPVEINERAVTAVHNQFVTRE